MSTPLIVSFHFMFPFYPQISKKLSKPERKFIADMKKGIPSSAQNAYLSTIKKLGPEYPVVHIDDSDVVKPDGYKFESFCIVRDGFESTSKKVSIKKDTM